jgi:hypothetical protein
VWTGRLHGVRALAVVVFFVGLGIADRHVELRGQLALGALTWLVLIAVLSRVSLERRLQTLVVVCAATCAEVIGSILWGVYTYRLHNLPLFVPPGHGLVYLGGFALADTAPVRARPRAFVASVTAVALAWGIAGVTVLPRSDIGGLLGIAVFLVFLLRGRAPAVYGGVFCMVCFLELWGTAAGIWQWHAVTPGLGLTMGNPPSGAASGYVLFDIAAIAVTARVLQAASSRTSSNTGATSRLRRALTIAVTPRIAAPSDT